jgi:FkbM family methyltransferase
MVEKLIYDLGVHKGKDTAYYLARGFRVIGIEADPDLHEQCQARFEKEIASGRLTLIHGAIVEDDNASTMRFYKNRHNDVWGTVVKRWADRNALLGAHSEEITVPVEDFAALFSSYGCPHYLKIDIEGMDLVCLKKLLATSCRPRYVSIESEKIDFQALVEEFDTFEALGYHRFFLQQQQDIHLRKVPPDSVEGHPIDYRFQRGASGPFGADLGESWQTRAEALTRYRKIFREYRWFGDDTLFGRTDVGRKLAARLQSLLGRPLPGWYDTHARRD